MLIYNISNAIKKNLTKPRLSDVYQPKAYKIHLTFKDIQYLPKGMCGWMGVFAGNGLNATHPYGNSLMRQHAKSHEQTQLNNQANTAVLNCLFTPIMSFLMYTHTFLYWILFDPSPLQTDTIQTILKLNRETLFRSHNKRLVVQPTACSPVLRNRRTTGLF